MIVTREMPLVKRKALFLFFLLRIFKKRYSSLTGGLSSSFYFLFLFFPLSNNTFLGSNTTIVMYNFNTFGDKKVKQKLLDGCYNHGVLPKGISVKLLMDFGGTPLSTLYIE